MARPFKELTGYLVDLGTDKIPHSGVMFLAHLIGVYRDLKEWGAPEHVCVTGLFHSIYGTEMFRGFALPPLVRALGPAPAIAIDALAFGLLHLDDPVAVPPLALLGATLAWLRWRTQSLWPSFVLHFTNNLVAFLILLVAP